LGDSAILQSNNVSFMKIDDLDADCRNLLVFGESYICYSVTQKRTSIRAIDSVSGEKVLLKAHESCILDIKVSITEPDSFCSCDNGDASNKPHIVIWKRSPQKPLEITQLIHYSIPAKIIQPHPMRNVWAISNGRAIGLLSMNSSYDLQATTYQQLKAHLILETEFLISKKFYSYFCYYYCVIIYLFYFFRFCNRIRWK
jgi:hypothetical protein